MQSAGLRRALRASGGRGGRRGKSVQPRRYRQTASASCVQGVVECGPRQWAMLRGVCTFGPCLGWVPPTGRMKGVHPRRIPPPLHPLAGTFPPSFPDPYAMKTMKVRLRPRHFPRNITRQILRICFSAAATRTSKRPARMRGPITCFAVWRVVVVEW